LDRDRSRGRKDGKERKKQRDRQTDRRESQAAKERESNQLSEYIQFDWIKLKGKTS